MAYETAFGICYHLEDPVESLEAFDDGDEDVEWSLYRIRDGLPLEPLAGLHESLLGTDPSGREMRPVGALGPQGGNEPDAHAD